MYTHDDDSADGGGDVACGGDTGGGCILYGQERVSGCVYSQLLQLLHTYRGGFRRRRLKKKTGHLCADVPGTLLWGLGERIPVGPRSGLCLWGRIPVGPRSGLCLWGLGRRIPVGPRSGLCLWGRIPVGPRSGL